MECTNRFAFKDNVLDVVYSSHFLEHLQRERVLPFLLECRRVLKPGGIIIIVVPDLEDIIRRYVESINLIKKGMANSEKMYNDAVNGLFDQMVRTVSGGTKEQKGLARLVDLLIIGSPSRRGELHKWMYDQFSMSRILMNTGFINIEVKTFDQSLVDRWNSFKLDINPDGKEYKPGSLYMEAIK